MKDFEEIYNKERNEHTAIVLMLGVLSQKLSDIATKIDLSNKLSNDILSCLKSQIIDTKAEVVFVNALKVEDYIE